MPNMIRNMGLYFTEKYSTISLVLFFMMLKWCLQVDCYRLHANRETSQNNWYTRYPFYPPYCATPSEMDSRRIPPLQRDKRLGESRLRHVTAILRHGSRTPYKAGLNCWEGYDTNPETSVWNCNLTAYLAPPPPSEISREEGNNNNHDESMFLFEKRYDALNDVNQSLNNHLKGSCQLGQLLLQGYEQEFTNGEFLRDAYAYDETKYNHDARMRLLDISTKKTSPNNVWDDVYYRVDDESRTLLSGQVILRGLFGQELDTYFSLNKKYPVIPLHTADYDRDILFPNHQICPRLVEVWDRNSASPGFQQLNNSDEATLLRQFQVDVLKIPNPDRDMDAIDCIMTTMCTDRPLPDALNDYKPLDHQQDSKETSKWSNVYGTNILQRLHDFDARTYVYNVKANKAEYAKLAMQPLWSEIMGKVSPHIQGKTTELKKLSLFSGHDTTIIPLLASIGVWNDTAWPPYASMVVIELHELNVDGNSDRKIFPTNFAFRLIYNGVVITSNVESCTPGLELCNVEVLTRMLLQERDCTRKYNDTIPYKDAVSRTKEILASSDGIMYFLLVVTMSAGFGGVVMYIYLMMCFPRQHYSRTPDIEDNAINGNTKGYSDEKDECRSESSFGAQITEIS